MSKQTRGLSAMERVGLALASFPICALLAVMCFGLGIVCLLFSVPAALVALFGEVKRVQNPDGTLSFQLSRDV